MLAKIKSAVKPHHIFAGLFCMVVLAWSCYPYILMWLFSPDATLEKLGPFGDLYGGLNTLFSGMALLGLGVNIYMQGVQIQKLEAKEDQNEKLLKAQVEAVSITTLLQHIDKKITDIEPKKLAAKSNFDKLNSRLSVLAQELSASTQNFENIRTRLESHEEVFENLKSELMALIKEKPEDAIVNTQNLALFKDLNEPTINLLKHQFDALTSKIEHLKKDNIELHAECKVFEHHYNALKLELGRMIERRDELIYRLEQLCE